MAKVVCGGTSFYMDLEKMEIPACAGMTPLIYPDKNYFYPVKQQVQYWLQTNIKDWEAKSYLVAVSGGRDSIVLATIFKELGLDFSIAHCNFQLRSEASDADEIFVKAFAKKLGIPFFVKRFDTQKILNSEGGNLQETARNLRYGWFNELTKEHHFNYICVGTHLNDSAETLLMNLMRGSGLQGLSGIRSTNKNIIRPLIETSRNEIDSYIKQNILEFREDESNASNKYERNRWRNEIIPKIKELYPHFDSALKTSLEHLQLANSLVQKEVERTTKHLLIQKEKEWLISIPMIAELKPLNYYLFETLKPFGFNIATVNDLCNSDFSVGKQFYSPTYVITIDRNYLIIETKEDEQKSAFIQRKISITDQKIEQPLALSFDLIDVPEKFSSDTNFAYLDADKLTFPLTLRKWQQGDKFRPFGMKGMKKVSDFLIDNKVPLTEKQVQMVLLSGKDIVWLVGHRIDGRYAVKQNTKKVYFVILNNMKSN